MRQDLRGWSEQLRKQRETASNLLLLCARAVAICPTHRQRRFHALLYLYIAWICFAKEEGPCRLRWRGVRSRMAPGRKPPPWRRGQDGTRRRPRGGRRYNTGKARQLLFAASPLLLLVIGSLSSLTWGVVGVEAHVPAGEGDDRGGLGGGSFWRWGSSSENEPSLQGEAVSYRGSSSVVTAGRPCLRLVATFV